MLQYKKPYINDVGGNNRKAITLKQKLISLNTRNCSEIEISQS